MPVPTIPQITIFLDQSGTFHAEAPGLNGARRKIDISGSDSDIVAIIRTELQDQRNTVRERSAAELRMIQLENVKYVSEHHPNLVSRIWHNGELVFSRSLKRALRDTNLANTANASGDQPKTPRKERVNTAIAVDLGDLDLDL